MMLGDVDDASSLRTWEPGFEGDRRIVVARLGPFLRLFRCPRHFVKRFYHTVYDLAIEDWTIAMDQKLLGGLCVMHVDLSVRFQPTLTYVEEHFDALPDVARHIKSNYERLLEDAIQEELLKAEANHWIPDRLTEIEYRIEDRINESLMVQHIQCRAGCRLDPVFQELSEEDWALDGRFRHQSAYLEVMRRHHEFRDKRNNELFRQLEHDDQTRLVHEGKVLEQQRHEEDLQLEKKKRETAQLRMLLEEEEKHHAANLSHGSRLKRMERDASMKDKAEELSEQLRSEQELQREKDKGEMERLKIVLEEEEKRHEARMEHASRLKQMEADAEMRDKLVLMREQMRREAEFQQEKGEKETEQLKMALEEEERRRAAKLMHESRLKRMELEADMRDKERRYEATRQADVFLRHEIELLVLEKQRATLDREIHEARHGRSVPQQSESGEEFSIVPDSGGEPP
jgi:hypothetical protein